MSQLSNMPVENGQRLHVASSFFVGLAGVRQDSHGGEFACQCEVPLRLRNRSATIDGKPVTIVDVRKSGVAVSLIVVRFEFVTQED